MRRCERCLLLYVLCGLLQLMATQDSEDIEKTPTFRKSSRYYPDPNFIPTVNNVTVRLGDPAILPCTIQYLGTKQTSWNRLGDPHFLTIGTLTWVKDPNFIVSHKERDDEISEYNLVIQNTKLAYSGVYECQIIAKTKMVWHVNLNIVADSQDMPDAENVKRTRPRKDEMKSERAGTVSVQGKKFVDLGEEIHLFCNATGVADTPEEIAWFKDGDMITSADYPNVVITKYINEQDRALVSELIIDHGEGADSGTYICRSANHQVDSIDVTVLVSDTSNVKRGTGSFHSSIAEGKQLAGLASVLGGQCLLILLVSFVHLLHWMVT